MRSLEQKISSLIPFKKTGWAESGPSILIQYGDYLLWYAKDKRELQNYTSYYISIGTGQKHRMWSCLTGSWN